VLLKSKKLIFSDWDALQFEEASLIYAAKDAFYSRMVYTRMMDDSRTNHDFQACPPVVVPKINIPTPLTYFCEIAIWFLVNNVLPTAQ
jgi:hypothetical protein